MDDARRTLRGHHDSSAAQADAFDRRDRPRSLRPMLAAKDDGGEAERWKAGGSAPAGIRVFFDGCDILNTK